MQLYMLFRILFVALTSVAGLVLSGFMPALAQSEQSIVVLVNDEPITNYDITQRMRLLTVTTRKPANDAMRKKVIEDLISERIQLQEATRSSVIISDDQINEVLGPTVVGIDIQDRRPDDVVVVGGGVIELHVGQNFELPDTGERKEE